MSELEESLASTKYLAPAKDLGDAVMQVTLSPKADHFIVEIYDEKKKKWFNPNINQEEEITVQNPPLSYEASMFLKRRFKHGLREINRQGILHPIAQVPITDYSVSLIQKAWTNKKVISPLAKPFMQKIILREWKAELNAKRVAEWRDKGTVPTNEWFDEYDKHLHDVGVKFRGEPLAFSGYQKLFAFNSCQVNSHGFFCDPGTGKTLMMICKMDYEIDQHIKAHQSEDGKTDSDSRPFMTLICCPKSVRQNWVNELNLFSKHGESCGNNIFIHQLQGGNEVDRFSNFATAITSSEAEGKHLVIITGFETYVQTPLLHELEFDLCLFDESHNLSNISTKRTKTFLEIRDKFHHRIIATGTPIRNLPFDLFPQMEFLGDGYSGFDSYNAFKEFFGMYELNVFTGNGCRRRALVDFKNIPLLQEKLAKHCSIIRKEEALPYLPKKSWATRNCNLTKEQAKVYASLATALVALIESYGPNPDSITVNNILTQMLRLAQITSGFAATDAGTISRFDPNPKLELLVKLLKGVPESDPDYDDYDEETQEGILTDPNRKCLVWCCFVENLKMIQARLALDGIKSVIYHGQSADKDDIVTQFNTDPETRVFIGTAASGGVGLNLVGFDPYNAKDYTTNTTHVIHYSKNWSAVNADQAENRAHRHNTRVPVQILDLIVPRSIDDEIYKRVKGKTELSLSIQDVKEVLRLILKPLVNGA